MSYAKVITLLLKKYDEDTDDYYKEKSSKKKKGYIAIIYLIVNMIIFQTLSLFVIIDTLSIIKRKKI